jgi:hypothetical protein
MLARAILKCAVLVCVVTLSARHCEARPAPKGKGSVSRTSPAKKRSTREKGRPDASAPIPGSRTGGTNGRQGDRGREVTESTRKERPSTTDLAKLPVGKNPETKLDSSEADRTFAGRVDPVAAPNALPLDRARGRNSPYSGRNAAMQAAAAAAASDSTVGVAIPAKSTVSDFDPISTKELLRELLQMHREDAIERRRKSAK